MEELFLAKGKRGEVFLIEWKGKPAVVKRLNPKSDRLETLRYEARFLHIANKLGLGPKLYSVQERGIIMEYVEGELILDFFANHPVRDIRQVCESILLQCRILDGRKLNKMELTNPYKHIIIRKMVGMKRETANDRWENKRKPSKSVWEPVMIDFERCHESQKPKNVTQFLQFLSSGLVRHALGGKASFDQKTLWRLACEYKKTFSEGSFDQIMDEICKIGRGKKGIGKIWMDKAGMDKTGRDKIGVEGIGADRIGKHKKRRK